MDRLNRLLAVCATLISFAGSPVAAEKLPLWELEGTRGNVYLLGSVHFLRASDYPLPAGMESALDAADSLVMEIDMDDLDPLATQQILGSIGANSNSQSLQDVMGAEDYAKANELAQKIGIDLAMFSPFKPWFVALTVTQLRMMQMGFDPNWGIETRFTAQAAEQGKSIAGLETLEEQLGFLDQLDAETQKLFLLQSLEDAVEVEAEVQRIVSAWRGGDTAALEELLVEGLQETPGLYEAILTDRNRNWVPQIARLAEEPGTHLVVVGTMHLVGKDSVLALLEAQGISSRQLSAE